MSPLHGELAAGQNRLSLKLVSLCCCLPTCEAQLWLEMGLEHSWVVLVLFLQGEMVKSQQCFDFHGLCSKHSIPMSKRAQ